MLSIHIPAKLRWLEQQPEGAQWLRELPGRIQSLAQRWQLQVDLDHAFPNSHVSYVAPAFCSSGKVVLKVRWPDRESSGEADALRLWAGDGAVQLIDDCADEHALLIEYCHPGLPLSKATNVDQIGIPLG